jgi:hypothetical protein
VAASVDTTAPVAQGGNTVLEVATGPIEASSSALAGLAHTLAATSISDANSGATRTTQEDTELAISGLSITDADSPANLTLRVQTAGGTARIATLDSATVSSGSNGSVDFTVTGSLAQVNAALATLRYTPELNKNSSTIDFAPQIVLTATDVSNSGTAATLTLSGLEVTAVNDAPVLSSQAALSLSEGGNATFDLSQLAPSNNALDADIATGQQVIEQLMLKIASLPDQGTLTYNGGVVVVGTVIPVSSLSGLRFTHSGADINSASPITVSFGVTVSDGGGGATSGTVNISIAPVNTAPTVSGSPTLIEGQVKAVAPTINLGDAFDTLANAAIVIDEGGRELIDRLNLKYTNTPRYTMDDGTDNVRVVVRLSPTKVYFQ